MSQQHPQHDPPQDDARDGAPRRGREGIDDAGRAFARAAASLRAAGYRTWPAALRAFVHALGDAPPLVQAVAPLRGRTYDLSAWMEERTTGLRWHQYGGAQPLELPPDPQDAAAFALQLLDELADPATRLEHVLIALAGVHDDNDRRVRRVSTELLGILTPYVDRRLDTLRRAAPPPRAAQGGIVINGDHATVGAMFGGPASVSSSNFAAGVGGSVTQSSHAPRSDLSREIAGWTGLLGAVEADRHAEVRAAIDALARAADEGGVRPSQLVVAAETVVEAGPTLRERVGGLLQRAGGAAATALAKSAGTAAATGIASHHDQVMRALALAWDHLAR